MADAAIFVQLGEDTLEDIRICAIEAMRQDVNSAEYNAGFRLYMMVTAAKDPL